jgi:hypothetical protein
MAGFSTSLRMIVEAGEGRQDKNTKRNVATAVKSPEVTTDRPSYRVFPMQSMKVLSLVMTLALGWSAQRYESVNLVFTRVQ